jgi:hypothetical protein
MRYEIVNILKRDAYMRCFWCIEAYCIQTQNSLQTFAFKVVLLYLNLAKILLPPPLNTLPNIHQKKKPKNNSALDLQQTNYAQNEKSKISQSRAQNNSETELTSIQENLETLKEFEAEYFVTSWYDNCAESECIWGSIHHHRNQTNNHIVPLRSELKVALFTLHSLVKLYQLSLQIS